MGEAMREPEVTRTVYLSCETGYQDVETSIPHRKQTVIWTGPIQTLFGYPSEEIECSEKWWRDRIHPDDRQSVLQSLSDHLVPAPHQPLAAESRIWGSDYRFRKADGTYLLISDRAITTRDDYGNAICIESVMFDKCARRKQRQDHARLFESQNHLALITNNTPSGIFMLDPQGYCIFMNSAAEQISGFTFQEVYDYTFHASVHSCRRNGEPYPIHQCPIVHHQQNGTAAKNESEVFVHKDGSFYDIEYSVSPIGNYATGGAVIEFRDVTEQKRIERERLNAILMNEQQSVRIKADEVHKANMTSFVSFICHELRNPLQGVTSSAEFLLDTLQKLDALASQVSTVKDGILTPESIEDGTRELTINSAAKSELDRTAGVQSLPALAEMESLIKSAQQLVGNIQTCADHQALIINNVLDLSRLDAGKVEPAFEVVDMQALGQQTVVMMSAKAQYKSIDLSLVGDASPLYLKADATIIRQILLNLVSNAIKFTPEHGKITIRMYAESQKSLQRTTFHGSVTDNGLGVSETEQLRLFQRFSQANRKVAQLYGGSGLGLSISKELVRVLGGEMQVESAPGKGSTFSFTSVLDTPTKEELQKFLHLAGMAKDEILPSILPGKPDITAVNGMTTSSAPKFRLIGIAEDNPINLQFLARSLKKLGYQFELYTNGQEIFDKFCEPYSKMDCCILDMSMPVMDGLEAARLMRQFESSCSLQKTPKRVPIIALSGNALKEQITEAMAAGVSDYLIKPCKKADLARTLQYWEQIVHTGAEPRPLFERRVVT